MINKTFLAVAFFSASLSSEIAIKIHDEENQKNHSFILKQDTPQNLKKFHHTLLFSSSIKDPQRNNVDFIEKKTLISGQEVQRLTPLIDGIVVEGADGIYHYDREHESFDYTYFRLPKASFKLSGAESLEKAMASQTLSLVKNPYIEKINGSFEPIWLMHFGELRPAYKTRLPTLSIFDMKDIYIDAETGDTLKIEESALFDSAKAKVFVYSPTDEHVDTADLKDVVLENLVDVQEGGFLRGEYMQVRNCCKYFTCPTDGSCSEEEKRCALPSHQGARQTRELIQLPTDTLGLDPLMTLPPTISVDTVRCTYLPFAKASYQKDNHTLGFFDTPIDEPGSESEMDRFSEIQAYFSMMSFFKNIRGLLEDDTWCLRSTAMTCEKDGTPKMENGTPVNPYRVFVNQMVPDMKLGSDQSDPDNFIVQILAGKGSKDKPIVLNTLTRMGNAAFVPALSQLKTSTPRADEILSDLIKPYDHNVFFQGVRDFAYDGGVVFHEFMHAITTSLVNKLNSMGLNEWGIHSEPGSLNEGWSDYFSAAFVNSPNIGGYAALKDGDGEASLRNIKNDVRCPDDVIGEVHNDSQVWSGALWAIREQVTSQDPSLTPEFDRAVLTALSQATTTEDFKTQSGKLLNAIRNRPKLGEKVAEIAEDILDQRGIKDCFRAYTLSFVDGQNRLTTQKKSMMFIPSKNQIGLKNYAPASSEFEIAIPAGAKKMTLSWKQYLGGTGALLGTETTPSSTSNIIPLSFAYSFDTPIIWKFEKAYSKPYRYDRQMEESSVDAEYKDGYWQATLDLNFGRCEQKVMYASLLSKDFKYIIKNAEVSFEMDNQDRSNCQFAFSFDDTPLPASCSSSSPELYGLCLVLMALLRRKR